MADIRKTGVLDDFERADENPALPPWYFQPNAIFPMRIDGGLLDGLHIPPSACLDYWGKNAYGGNQVEMWGVLSGSPALSDSWRFGMYVWSTCPTDRPDGYQALIGQGVGGVFLVLRRYDVGGFTTLVNVTPYTGAQSNNGIVLYRITGDLHEIYSSTDDGANWTQHISYTDTPTHDGPYFFILGTTGLETAWKEFGGGAPRRTQIYRYVSN